MTSGAILFAPLTQPNRGPHGFKTKLGNGARLGGPGYFIAFVTMATFQQR